MGLSIFQLSDAAKAYSSVARRAATPVGPAAGLSLMCAGPDPIFHTMVNKDIAERPPGLGPLVSHINNCAMVLIISKACSNGLGWHRTEHQARV